MEVRNDRNFAIAAVPFLRLRPCEPHSCPLILWNNAWQLLYLRVLACSRKKGLSHLTENKTGIRVAPRKYYDTAEKLSLHTS